MSSTQTFGSNPASNINNGYNTEQTRLKEVSTGPKNITYAKSGDILEISPKKSSKEALVSTPKLTTYKNYIPKLNSNTQNFNIYSIQAKNTLI